MAFAETQKLTVQIDLKGNLSTGLRNAARSLQGLEQATTNTQRSLGKFSQNLQRGIVIGATAAVGGLVAVVKAAGDFQAQMNTIATIVDRKDIAKIGEQLRKTARDTGIALDDLTSAYYDLASAGIKGELATKTLNNAVTLGIGGLATTAETVNLLSTAINAYGLDAAGAQKATDQFAQAIADGVIHADQIASTFADVASIAKTYKVGIDQIATSYAFLTAQGVAAGEVTTEMQRAIISLIKPTAELETAQKKLGVSFTKEIATKGLVGALQELRVYSDKTGVPLISLLGRIEAVKYTLQTTGPNFKGYNAELAKMGNVAGVAAAQMAERQQGLNYQLNLLKTNLKDAAITIGSTLLPKLEPLVKRLTDFIQLPTTQSKIADFAAKLADGFTKFADAIQKVDWKPFIDGLKISAEIAKTAVGLFMGLPKELQAAAIGAFAVNKVTGGLPTSIAKDVGGAVIGHFADRGSSPANPLWVTSVGGVGGVGGAAAGPGLLENILTAIGKGAAVGGASAIANEGGLFNQLKTLDDPALQSVFAARGKELIAAGKSTTEAFKQATQELRDGTLALRKDRLSQTSGPGNRLKDDISMIVQQQAKTATAQVKAIDRLEANQSSVLADVLLAIKIIGTVFTGGGSSLNKVLFGALTDHVGSQKPQEHGTLPSMGNVFNPTVKLDPSVVTDLRKTPSAVARAATAQVKAIERAEAITAQKTESVRKAVAIAATAIRSTQAITYKIESVMRTAAYAARATTEAIKDKDLSTNITVPITNKVVVNSREIASAQATFHNYFVTGDHNR